VETDSEQWEQNGVEKEKAMARADEELDVEMQEPEESQKEDQFDENGERLEHIGDAEFLPQDKHVVKQSTIEEALSTKSKFDQMKNYERGMTHRKEQQKDEATQEVVREGSETPNLINADSSMAIINANFSLELITDDLSRIKLLQERLEAMEVSPAHSKSLELKWSIISDSVAVMASELAENLRTILEPTIASKLQGDYRTGKRLNMRRLVAYIASDYRKNRIWMRRTKKAQRNYRIAVAVDDSASMKENLMTEVTCEAVCLIEKALRQLEVGELSICKFGKTVKILSEFSTQSNADLGPILLDELQFEQDKTDLPNLLCSMDEHFASSREYSAANQMLIILGDGRGVLADGMEKVRSAIARLMENQITVLFVIVDSHEKSVMEMKVAQFTDSGQVQLTPYMNQFPFPFYALIRNIATLPATIAEAIRQWFETTLGE
jgi:midasin